MSYPTLRVESWSDYRDLVESGRFRSWGFRGQADATWPLYSSLSRYLLYAGVDKRAWNGQEQRIMRIFRRKAHLFLEHVPAPDDAFEWLALMQHHGAPSRLLDVTWSPYVALFFALERGAKEAAVWAFNSGALNRRDQLQLKTGETVDLRGVGTWVPESFERNFVAATLPFAVIGEPYTMNRRLIAQSGTFLIPSMLDRPVDEILGGYVDSDSLIVKIVLDVPRIRSEAMYALYQMNLTPATLFPDLDGLARSMAYELESHWAFDPRTMQPYPGYPPPETFLHWNSEPEAHEAERSTGARGPHHGQRG